MENNKERQVMLGKIEVIEVEDQISRELIGLNLCQLWPKGLLAIKIWF